MFQSLWNSISEWFKSKGGVTHFFATVYLGLIAAYAAVPAFHDLVVSVNAKLPGWIEQVVLAAIGIIAWYKDTNNIQLQASARALVKTATLLVISILLCSAVVGCSTWERNVFQTLSASKSVIDQAQSDYETGKLPHSKAAYDAINAAKASQTVAVNQMVAYEALKAQGGTATALGIAQSQVAAALSDLPSLIAAVKALATTTPATTPIGASVSSEHFPRPPIALTAALYQTN